VRPLLLAAAALAAVAAGCAGGSDTAPALEDGRHFGYIRSVETSSAPATIELDVAEFLTGEDANMAAVDDGVIPDGEPVPNDYYIRNEDTSAAPIPVSSEVAVTHIQCPDSCTEGIPGEFDDFAGAFDDPGESSLSDEYRGAESQYWVTVRHGEAVAIDEQYLP
jgi:hypothetical protein